MVNIRFQDFSLMYADLEKKCYGVISQNLQPLKGPRIQMDDK